MAWHAISSLLSTAASLLPSIIAASSSSSSSTVNSEKERRAAFGEDLEKLMRTLERIKATLYDAEKREISDRSVKLWLKELKRVAYDAEDLLAEYSYEVTRVRVEAARASRASGSHKRKQMECIAPIPDGMVDQFKQITSRFDEIAKDREALRLRESDGARRPSNIIVRPSTGHMVDEASIFGRHTEIEDVINLLLSEKEKRFSVISIIGKGGLGKTAIAQLVCKDRRVRTYFDLLAWVCVSEEFNVGRLIKETIESISELNSKMETIESIIEPDCEVTSLSALQEKLKKRVKGKSVLLILDDVWNEEGSLWELFRTPFKEAKLMRILVTTRSKKVAEVMQTATCFWPDYLCENYCWQLFQHYAFGSTSYIVPTHLVEIGRNIMRKCGGLPLAVKSIASLLRHEADEESWREILESDLWKSNPSNDIFPALQISYTRLPVHLKPCLLFLSMYPKDYTLEKKNLIELWISHGYIESRGRTKTAAVGVEYYKELKERSFFDVISDNYWETCKLHDIIHDLARLNSENEHYAVHINRPLDTHEGNILRETYHLYAKGFMEYVIQIPQQYLKGLRTLSTDLDVLFLVNPEDYLFSVNPEDYECPLGSIFNLTKFKSLRALELKSDSLTEISDSIAQLKLLSYLCIASKMLKMLPESIGLLYNLQVFILDCYRSPLENLPESIGSIANLRSLYIRSEHLSKLPKSLWSLSNLLRLEISVYFLKEVPSDIKYLCNLQQLTIHARRIQALPDTIGCLSSLEEIAFPILGALPELPGALGNCSKLKTLKIGGCSVNCNPRGPISFPEIRTMEACLSVRTIGWLKDMKHLQGDLIIEGLGNISSLADAQQADLRSKCNINTLVLRWNINHDHRMNAPKVLTIRLIKEPDAAIVVPADIHFRLLECLQPHSHIKRLVIEGYPSAILPDWMGDPFSLQSIEEILLVDCDGL